MKCFKVGDKIKRVNTGLIGMPLGSVWKIDALHDDGTIILEGSNRVLNINNFDPIEGENAFFEVGRYASPIVT